MNLNDLLTITSLTDSINKLPTVPSVVGSMGLFEEKGIPTTGVTVDEKNGKLYLIEPISRDADPEVSEPGDRRARTFETVHLPDTRNIRPSDLQNLRAFGTESELTQQAKIINDHLQEMRNAIDATRELLRVGALRGKLVSGKGRVIYDLYTEFGVQQQRGDLAFSTANTDVRAALVEVSRKIDHKLNGVLVRGKRALCGPAFFDALTGHPSVKKAYEGYLEGQDKLTADLRKGFTYGGIEFIEYDVMLDGLRFIPENVAQIFPVASGIFKMYNAPANYNEAVNTVGKPYYAKTAERKFNKGWEMEAQSNPLALCLIPEALFELRAA